MKFGMDNAFIFLIFIYIPKGRILNETRVNLWLIKSHSKLTTIQSNIPA